jgi:hypothetical protein
VKKLNKNNSQRPFVYTVLGSIITCVLSFFCTATALAQGTSTTSLPKETSTQNEPQGFSLKIYSSGYSSNKTETKDKIDDGTNADSNTNFEAQYLYASVAASSAKKIHFIFGLYPQESASYVAAPELFYSQSTSLKNYNARAEYTIGRRQTVQNKLDDVFNLGVVNSYFSQDLINYTAEGLTGLHTKAGNEYLSVGANFYPIFIPNQGPANIERNGKLVGVNRWAQSTPRSFIYNNQENNIDYKISDYSLFDILNNPGYSLTLQAGDLKKNNIEMNFSYSDTPINDVIISRTVIADLNLNGTVEIFPVVRYSQKLTSDFKFKVHNTTFFASYLMDTPHNKLETDELAVQVLEPISGYGAGFQVDMSDFVNRGFNVGVAYGKFYGGEIRNTDPNGDENTLSLSNNRLLYQNPLKLSAELEGFQMLSNSVFFNANWIYDGVQDGSLLSLSARHEPLRNLNVSVGVDLVGVVDDTENDETKKNFLSKHKADDRLTGAVQYAF